MPCCRDGTQPAHTLLSCVAARSYAACSKAGQFRKLPYNVDAVCCIVLLVPCCCLEWSGSEASIHTHLYILSMCKRSVCPTAFMSQISDHSSGLSSAALDGYASDRRLQGFALAQQQQQHCVGLPEAKASGNANSTITIRTWDIVNLHAFFTSVAPILLRKYAHTKSSRDGLRCAQNRTTVAAPASTVFSTTVSLSSAS